MLKKRLQKFVEYSSVDFSTDRMKNYNGNMAARSVTAALSSYITYIFSTYIYIFAT